MSDAVTIPDFVPAVRKKLRCQRNRTVPQDNTVKYGESEDLCAYLEMVAYQSDG